MINEIINYDASAIKSISLSELLSNSVPYSDYFKGIESTNGIVSMFEQDYTCKFKLRLNNGFKFVESKGCVNPTNKTIQ